MPRLLSRKAGRYLRYSIIVLVIIILLPVIFRKSLSEDSSLQTPKKLDLEVPDVPGFQQAASIVRREYHLSDSDSRVVFGFNPKNTPKKDWHNYGQIRAESLLTGPGEQGSPFRMPSERDKVKQQLYRENGFNALGSDLISINRSVKDIRPEECKKKFYLEKLPNVSVILPFHNEHWTTLLRSVWSILNRSPPELLSEIILADDFSSKDFLKDKLTDYVAKNWKNRVKLVRTTKREGLIRARLLGAKAARGQVLIFLDSHSECNTNWLPPLIEPIAFDYRTVVCPFVDVVDYETFEYRPQDEGARGAFDWEFYYKRLPLLPDDTKDPTEPFKSPVMAGGYFAISSKWFWELGGYDEGLDIWGGEQYELSFKIWQCGGQMVDAPCSHVGHIYRKFAPFPNPGVGDFIGRNYKRVAEVWMDEYKEFLYNRRKHYRDLDPGDLTKQKALREKLKCKSFKWFMETVAFDLVLKYPPVEPPLGAEGELRNLAANKCIDTRFKKQDERFELETCLKDGGIGEQKMEYTWLREIHPKKSKMCLDVSKSYDKAPVILYPCHGLRGNQEWKYRVKSGQLYHPVSGLCMDCDPERGEIFMSHCSRHSKSQRWAWEKMNQTLVERWAN